MLVRSTWKVGIGLRNALGMRSSGSVVESMSSWQSSKLSDGLAAPAGSESRTRNLRKQFFHQPVGQTDP